MGYYVGLVVVFCILHCYGIAQKPSLFSFFENVPTIWKPQRAYDYIVVGAGTAGSIVAARLANETTNTVLIIEAGSQPNGFSKIPYMSPALLRSSMDWDLLSEPQKYSGFGLKDKRMRCARGKTLGGSSGINFMTYLWSLPKDMDTWANSTGDDQWKWENFRKYFVRVVNGTSGGPMRVSRFDCHKSDVCTQFLAATKECGLPVRDANAESDYGLQSTPFTIFEGKRFTPVDGYVTPTLRNPRANLQILANALVENVK